MRLRILGQVLLNLGLGSAALMGQSLAFEPASHSELDSRGIPIPYGNDTPGQPEIIHMGGGLQMVLSTTHFQPIPYGNDTPMEPLIGGTASGAPAGPMMPGPRLLGPMPPGPMPPGPVVPEAKRLMLTAPPQRDWMVQHPGVREIFVAISALDRHGEQLLSLSRLTDGAKYLLPRGVGDSGPSLVVRALIVLEDGGVAVGQPQLLSRRSLSRGSQSIQ